MNRGGYAVTLVATLVFAGCAPKVTPPQKDDTLSEKGFDIPAIAGQYAFFTPSGGGLPADSELLAAKLSTEIARATACPPGKANIKIPVPKYPWRISAYSYECALGDGRYVLGGGSITVRQVAPGVYLADVTPSGRYRAAGIDRHALAPYAVHPKPKRASRTYSVEEAEHIGGFADTLAAGGEE